MPRIPVKLTAGDGLKTVILTASDAAGNVTEGRLEAEIHSDTAAPNNPLIIINGGGSTENPIVRLELSAEDDNGIAEMMLSNDPSFQGARWEPYAPVKTEWQLDDSSNGNSDLFAAHDGIKRVYVRFRDAASNAISVEEAASDAIDLDRLGEIRLAVTLKGPASTPVTDVTFLRVKGDPKKTVSWASMHSP